MKFKIAMALIILFMISSPAHSTTPTACPIGTKMVEEGGKYGCKKLESDKLVEYCAIYSSNIEVLFYCQNKENLEKIDLNSHFKIKINQTVYIESKNNMLRLMNINNTGVTIYVLDHLKRPVRGEFNIGERENMGDFYLTLREVGVEKECLNCDRICPGVCVKLWELRKKDKFSERECVLNECGSGCGPDGVSSFNSEEECRSSLLGQNSKAKAATFYIEEIKKNPNVSEESIPQKPRVNFYIIGGLALFVLIIFLLILRKQKT